MSAAPLSLREFDKLFKEVEKTKREKRREATRTLTPAILREHLASRKPLPLEYGRNADGTAFTREDLKYFAKRAKDIEAKYGKGQAGITLSEFWARMDKKDRQRASSEIKNASIYRISQGRLDFRVSASPQSQYKEHKVSVRLEDWARLMVTPKSPTAAVKEAIERGRLSFQCDCGRMQYWYRYLLTVMGACISPPTESAYPKIRNPRLGGIACKHVVKAVVNLSSPAVQRLLSNELERQRAVVGFSDDKRKTTRYMTEKEMRSMYASKADVKKAYDRYRASLTAYNRKKEAEKKAGKVKKTGTLKEQYAAKGRRKLEIEKEKIKTGAAVRVARKEKARADAAEKKLKEASDKGQDQLLSALRTTIDMLRASGVKEPRAVAISITAAQHGRSIQEITTMADTQGVK